MLLDRDRQAGRYLEWKVRLFIVAAVVALTGIYLDSRWVTGAAIVILLGGLSLRWIPKEAHAEEPEDD